MAGNKQKHYFYVLVFSEDGPKYVTGVNNAERVSYWEADKKPLLFTRERAEDMARGLTWNGHHAVVVSSQWEIYNHPYNYDEYKCEWVEITGAEDNTAQN